MGTGPATASFNAKALLIEMTAITNDVETSLKLLVQGKEVYTPQGKQDALTTLETAAQAFHSKCHLDLPILMWQAAAQDLDDREASAVGSLRRRIGNLAASTCQAPLRDWKGAEHALKLIRWVELNLKGIEAKLPLEEISAMKKTHQKGEETKRKDKGQKLERALFMVAGSLLTLLVNYLTSLFD